MRKAISVSEKPFDLSSELYHYSQTGVFTVEAPFLAEQTPVEFCIQQMFISDNDDIYGKFWLENDGFFNLTFSCHSCIDMVLFFMQKLYERL